jgi:uncharacterized protein
MKDALLLAKEDFDGSRLIPSWVRDDYSAFSAKVTTRGFPCHFGTIAETKGELRYTYATRNDLSTLPATLGEFMDLSRAHPDARYAMIGFFEPEPIDRAFDYYQGKFWDICNFLHAHDTQPWPESIPADTSDPLWEFCFAGEPLFLFTGFPAYKQRQSRNFGRGLMILFQPKRVFNGLEGATPGGIRAREMIRPKLQAWDGGMEMHPDFNIIDEELAYRWKQYCASDDNSPTVGTCPFHKAP